MSVEPTYGATPLLLEEEDFLLPHIRAALPSPIPRADIYLLEKGIESELVRSLFPSVLTNAWSIEEMLSLEFLCGLHMRLYSQIWSWAGQIRRHELNIGVAPEQVRVEMKMAADNLLYRWEVARDLSARELGIAVHAEFVRVHPFVDGNGRITRLLADLVYIAAQGKHRTYVYDWDVNKVQYIGLLQEFDRNRDPKPLAEFIPLLNSGE